MARAFALALGLGALGMGGAGLIGWHLQHDSWIRIGPDLPPMQYNTALAMSLAGLALMALTRQWRRWTIALASVVAGIGALTQLEYVLGVNLGIDQLVMRHHLALDSTHPGRMAANTSVAYAFAGLALLLRTHRGGAPLLLALAAVLGAAVTALGFSSLVSFLFPIRSYGWGQLTGMALHTSLGFCMLGPGIVAACRDRTPRALRELGWSPLLGTTLAAVLAVASWQRVELHQLASLRALSQRTSEGVQLSIDRTLERFRDELAPLRERTAQTPDPAQWREVAQRALDRNRGMRALVWLSDARDPLFAERDPPELRAALETHAARREDPVDAAALTELLASQGDVVLALAPENGSRVPAEDRLLCAVDLAASLQEGTLAQLGPFRLRVRWNGHAVLPRSDPRHTRTEPTARDDSYSDASYRVVSEAVRPEGRWVVESWPRAATVDAVRSTGTGVLLGGLTLAALCGLTLHLFGLTRRQAEAERARAAERELLLDCLSEGVIGANTHGEFLFFNRTAEELLGRASQRIPPEQWSATYQIYEPDGQTEYPPAQLPLVRALRGESCTGVELFYRRRGSDEIRVLRASARPLRDAGRVVGGVVVFSDVTEEHARERERSRNEVKLQESRRLESLGQIAAGVAHEINTPAQFVRDNLTFLEQSIPQVMTLLERYRCALRGSGVSPATTVHLKSSEDEVGIDELAEEFPDAIGQSLEGVERIAKIAASLKEFAHPGSPEKHRADLNRIVRSTLVVASNEWRYVADVTEELDAALPPVPCVTSEMGQVVLNWIVNAAQAVSQSPRSHEGVKGRITVRTRAERGWAVLEVADDGPGVPEAIRCKIFEPFFTTKPMGQGTGQGLALVQRIVVSGHQGTLDVSSAPGGGACFRVSLPLEPQAP